jgi:hypothetical protein
MRGADQACADGLYSERRHSVTCKPCDQYKLRADASVLDFDSSSKCLFRMLFYSCAVVVFVLRALSARG